jgi:hypothetical protein
MEHTPFEDLHTLRRPTNQLLKIRDGYYVVAMGVKGDRMRGRCLDGSGSLWGLVAGACGYGNGLNIVFNVFRFPCIIQLHL